MSTIHQPISNYSPMTVVSCNNEKTAKTNEDYWQFDAVLINSVEIKSDILNGKTKTMLFMYAQNRLFYVIQETQREWSDPETPYYTVHYYMYKGQEKLDGYVVIPYYDMVLDGYKPKTQMYIEEVEL